MRAYAYLTLGTAGLASLVVALLQALTNQPAMAPAALAAVLCLAAIAIAPSEAVTPL